MQTVALNVMYWFHTFGRLLKQGPFISQPPRSMETTSEKCRAELIPNMSISGPRLHTAAAQLNKLFLNTVEAAHFQTHPLHAK